MNRCCVIVNEFQCDGDFVQSPGQKLGVHMRIELLLQGLHRFGRDVDEGVRLGMVRYNIRDRKGPTSTPSKNFNTSGCRMVLNLRRALRAIGSLSRFACMSNANMETGELSS